MSEERKVACKCGREMVLNTNARNSGDCTARYACVCGWMAPIGRAISDMELAIERAYLAATATQPIDENTSDGYHTFRELYHHRAILFAALIAQMPNKAWKSKTHSDGSVWGGWFIVGLETPDGMATYHYAIDPYWNMFCCREVDRAPEWDGHTPAQAIERIALLAATPPNLRLTREQVEAMKRDSAVFCVYDTIAGAICTVKDAEDVLLEIDPSRRYGGLYFAAPPTPTDIAAARAAKGE